VEKGQPTPLQIGTKSVQWGLAVSRSFGDLPLKDPKHFNGPAHCRDLVSVMPEITTFDIKGGKDLALVRRRRICNMMTITERTKEKNYY
jgi:hypothetical protein